MRLAHSPQSRSSSPVQSLDLSGESKDPAREMLFAVGNGDVDAVSRLLHENQIDLTAIRNEDGKAALHLAIFYNHHDIARLLLKQAGDDPRVLDARDRQQYTPLMWAAARRNVAMMKALIDAGASTDRPMFSGGNPALPLREKFSLRMMGDARGDISMAFENAVKASFGSLAKLYLDAGADASFVFKRFIQTSQWKEMAWMIEQGFVPRSESLVVLSVLTDMLRRDDGRPATPVPSVLIDPKVMVRIFRAMSGQSDSAKLDALSVFRRSGADLDRVVEPIIASLHRQSGDKWGKKMDALRLLFAAGADSDGVLAFLAERGDRRSVQKLISFGVDVVASIAESKESRSAQATRLVAFEGLRFFLQSACSDTAKIGRMKAVMDGAGTSVAVQLLEDELRLKHYDAVSLLIAAQVPATYLLVDLCSSGNKASARKLIELGADGSSAMNLLLTRAKQHQAAGQHKDAREAQDAANELALILASHFLPAGPSNPGTLVRPGV